MPRTWANLSRSGDGTFSLATFTLLITAPKSYFFDTHIEALYSGGTSSTSLVPRTWQNRLFGTSACQPVTVRDGPINTYSQRQRQPGHNSEMAKSRFICGKSRRMSHIVRYSRLGVNDCM